MLMMRGDSGGGQVKVNLTIAMFSLDYFGS
jgi:hypothetical protein